MEEDKDPLEIIPETVNCILQEFTCRLCLYRHPNNVKFSSSSTIETDLADKLSKYFSIQMLAEQGLPIWICKLCQQTLDTFHNFCCKVNKIQDRLLCLLSVVQQSFSTEGEPFGLDAELDLIEATVGFNRGKKTRARRKEDESEPVRRKSTRRKRHQDSSFNEDYSVYDQRYEDMDGTVLVADKIDAPHQVKDKEEIVALNDSDFAIKTESDDDSTERSFEPVSRVTSNIVVNGVSKDDDLSSLEDQDWIGQGFSFDIDSDNDHTWEPPKSGQNRKRSRRKKRANEQMNHGESCENDKTELNDDANKAAKLRITATHGTEPKPKVSPGARKMLREEMNVKFVEFYGITCEICVRNIRENSIPAEPVKYQSFDALCTHMQAEHNERGYVKCCNCTMRERRRAEKHMLLHTEPGSVFKCNICNKQLSSQQSYRGHILLHLPDSERPFQCSECERGFVCKSDLTQHERQHLPEDKRLCFTCDICGSRFSAEAGMMSHKQRVHENIRPHLCDLCAKSFSSRCDMERHRAQIHGNVKREQCPECGKWFKGHSILKTHMRQHKGQLFKCQFCDKTYTVRSSWKAHLTKHSDEKPHKCPICEKSFKLPATLKMHLNQHTGELPYSCPFCPKKFASSGNYYTHRKRMHKDEVAQLKEETQAALATSGLPPTTSTPTVTKIRLSEVIESAKEKVAAKTKADFSSSDNLLPLPLVFSSASANTNVVGASIVITSSATPLSSSNGITNTLSVSMPTTLNASLGNGSFLLTQSARTAANGAIPIGLSSVPSSATPVHVIPTIKKLPNVGQLTCSKTALVRLISPDSAAKLVFMKKDQQSTIGGKEMHLSNQSEQIITTLSQEDINTDSLSVS